MRLNRPWSPALLIVLCWALSSCAEPLVPRQQGFHEAEFKGYRSSGSGSIVGRAFVVMRDDSQRVAADQLVEVTPVNDYTSEIVTVVFARNRELTSPDPRFEKYIRSSRTDANGNFTFHGLPDGEYYVTSAVYFTHWFWNNDSTEKVTMQDCIPVYTRVSVKRGQTVRITDWNYGRHTSK
jgi:hypothetical protein